MNSGKQENVDTQDVSVRLYIVRIVNYFPELLLDSLLKFYSVWCNKSYIQYYKVFEASIISSDDVYVNIYST